MTTILRTMRTLSLAVGAVLALAIGAVLALAGR